MSVRNTQSQTWNLQRYTRVKGGNHRVEFGVHARRYLKNKQSMMTLKQQGMASLSSKIIGKIVASISLHILFLEAVQFSSSLKSMMA